MVSHLTICFRMKLLIPVIQHNPLHYVNYELLRRSYFFSQALVSNLLSSFSNASWPVLRAKSKTILTTQLSTRQVARNVSKLNIGFRTKRRMRKAFISESVAPNAPSWTLHPSVQWKSIYLYRKTHSSLLGSPRNSSSSSRSSIFFEHFLASAGSQKASRPLVLSSLPRSLRARYRLAAFTSYLSVSRDTRLYRSTRVSYRTVKRNPFSLLTATVANIKGSSTFAQRLLKIFQRQSSVTKVTPRHSRTLRIHIGESRLRPQLSSKWSTWVKSRLAKIQINWTDSAKFTARRLTNHTSNNSSGLCQNPNNLVPLNFHRNILAASTLPSTFCSQRVGLMVRHSSSKTKFYRRRKWRSNLRYGRPLSAHRTARLSYLNLQPRRLKVLLSRHPRVSTTNRKRRRALNPRSKVYLVMYSYFMHQRRISPSALNSSRYKLTAFSVRRNSRYQLFLKALKHRRKLLLGTSRRVQKRNKLFKRKNFALGHALSQQNLNTSLSLPAWLFSGNSNRSTLLASDYHSSTSKMMSTRTKLMNSFSLLRSFTCWLNKPTSTSYTIQSQSLYLQSFHALSQGTPSQIQTLGKIDSYTPNFYPKYTFTFTSSPFFFLNYSLIALTRTSDVVELVNPRRSHATYLVFPDSDSVKATIFRRLNRQKSLFQNRRELLTTFYKRYNKKKSQGFLLNSPQGILTTNLSSSFSGLQRSPLFIGNDTPLYSIHRLNGLMRRERLPSVTPRIRRIRFKPGYGRIWRTARKSIKEILNLSVRYQYRLTPKLQRLYYRNRQASQTYSSLTLGFALLAGRFAFDRKTICDLLASSNVFLNGSVCQNLTIHLFINDFIQLLVNAKFYLVLRLLRAGMLARRYRLNRIFYRKITTINYQKYYKTPKMSRNLPNVFFDLQYLHGDIPKYFEVDYFSLSMFVVQDQADCANLLPRQSFVHNPLTLNMYNWKYIT